MDDSKFAGVELLEPLHVRIVRNARGHVSLL